MIKIKSKLLRTIGVGFASCLAVAILFCIRLEAHSTELEDFLAARDRKARELAEKLFKSHVEDALRDSTRRPIDLTAIARATRGSADFAASLGTRIDAIDKRVLELSELSEFNLAEVSRIGQRDLDGFVQDIDTARVLLRSLTTDVYHQYLEVSHSNAQLATFQSHVLASLRALITECGPNPRGRLPRSSRSEPTIAQLEADLPLPPERWDYGRLLDEACLPRIDARNDQCGPRFAENSEAEARRSNVRRGRADANQLAAIRSVRIRMAALPTIGAHYHMACAPFADLLRNEFFSDPSEMRNLATQDRLEAILERQSHAIPTLNEILSSRSSSLAPEQRADALVSLFERSNTSRAIAVLSGSVAFSLVESERALQLSPRIRPNELNDWRDGVLSRILLAYTIAERARRFLDSGIDFDDLAFTAARRTLVSLQYRWTGLVGRLMQALVATEFSDGSRDALRLEFASWRRELEELRVRFPNDSSVRRMLNAHARFQSHVDTALRTAGGSQ